jgi:hypothetical protein
MTILRPKMHFRGMPNPIWLTPDPCLLVDGQRHKRFPGIENQQVTGLPQHWMLLTPSQGDIILLAPPTFSTNQVHAAAGQIRRRTARTIIMHSTSVCYNNTQ